MNKTDYEKQTQEYLAFFNENLKNSHHHFDGRFSVRVIHDEGQIQDDQGYVYYVFELADAVEPRRNRVLRLHRDEIWNINEEMYDFIVKSDFWSNQRTLDNVGF